MVRSSRPVSATASSRLIVTAGIHDAFLEKLTSAAAGLIVGDALDATTQIGPVVDQKQLDQNLRYLKLAGEEGVTFAVVSWQTARGFS